MLQETQVLVAQKSQTRVESARGIPKINSRNDRSSDKTRNVCDALGAETRVHAG